MGTHFIPFGNVLLLFIITIIKITQATKATDNDGKIYLLVIKQRLAQQPDVLNSPGRIIHN